MPGRWEESVFYITKLKEIAYQHLNASFISARSAASLKIQQVKIKSVLLSYRMNCNTQDKALLPLDFCIS